ncbi:MAG: hypothetical protein ACP5JG_00395 [Anaerolineae bacterium]
MLSIDEAYVKSRLAGGPGGGQSSDRLLELFREMPRAEQRHGIRVCRALEARGFEDPDLLVAALFHDAGKMLDPPRLWGRVLVVLVERFLPRVAARWSSGMAKGLRRAFVVRRRHPYWGAELVAEAGASPRTVALIRSHDQPAGEDELLAALQRADEG